MKKTIMALVAGWIMAGPMSQALAADEAAPIACEVCSMKVDTKHKIHFRYELTDGKVVEIGSLTCAKKYWSDHKDQKMVFTAQDFVSGEWVPGDLAFFVVGSKLKFGTGMDKASVLVFKDKLMAEKAVKANGGHILSLDKALPHATGGHHEHSHAH